MAAVLFGVLEGAHSGSLHDALVHVGLTVALGGLTTCAVTYLLSEWRLCPVIGRVLAAETPTPASHIGAEAPSGRA